MLLIQFIVLHSTWAPIAAIYYYVIRTSTSFPFLIEFPIQVATGMPDSNAFLCRSWASDPLISMSLLPPSRLDHTKLTVTKPITSHPQPSPQLEVSESETESESDLDSSLPSSVVEEIELLPQSESRLPSAAPPLLEPRTQSVHPPSLISPPPTSSYQPQNLQAGIEIPSQLEVCQ